MRGGGADLGFVEGEVDETHRFIEGQLERDAKIVRRKTQSLERAFEPRSGAGARLGQHPVDVQQVVLA